MRCYLRSMGVGSRLSGHETEDYPGLANTSSGIDRIAAGRSIGEISLPDRDRPDPFRQYHGHQSSTRTGRSDVDRPCLPMKPLLAAAAQFLPTSGN